MKTLSDIAKVLGAKIKGDPNCVIMGLATIQNAHEGQLTFLSNPKYQKYLVSTQASAVVLCESDAENFSGNALIVDDPQSAYGKAAHIFADVSTVVPGLHPTVIVGKNCNIDPSAMILPNVVIGDNVVIGAGARVDQGCSIANDCRIGKDSHLYPNIVLYNNVKIGNSVLIHSGTIIGSDGFSNARLPGGRWKKIPQIGGVTIGSCVEIGANTTIDRGAIDDTVIEDGVKLDNLIQVAHNVHIGANTVIAACTGISGSTKIGKNCIIAGQVGFVGHIEIFDNVIITGGAMITKSIRKAGIYSSGTGFMENGKWKKNVVLFRKLDDIMRKIRVLLRKVGEK